jgi:hypothetical protein
MLTRNQRPTSHGLLHRVTPLLLMAVLLCSCTQPGEESPQPSGELKGMAEDKHVHHGIDYIEFAVTDMDQSKRFYQTAFDWKFNDYGPDYAGIQKPGGEAGGFRLESEVSAGSPLERVTVLSLRYAPWWKSKSNRARLCSSATRGALWR